MAIGANAAIITPNTATASSTFDPIQFGPQHTINGSGITLPLNLFSVHADYSFSNHWTSNAVAPTDQWISWGFSAPHTLSAIYIWNHRSNNFASNPGYAPTLFDLTIFDAANNVLLFLNNVALLPNPADAQTISFAETSNISSVRFDVEQTNGSQDYTGLAEVRFEGSPTPASGEPIPEPSSVALLLSGGTALAIWRRRR
jgi:hypothetical protein